MHGNVIDITGKTFGHLTVLSPASRPKTTKENGQFWLCRCTCGKEKVVHGHSLRRGQTKSCGCLQKEKATKHGMKGTRLYTIYLSIKQRCYYTKHIHYKDYGGRGIKMCDEWLDKENGFTNFYKWAIANGYSDDLSIDRINVDGNYEPNNCRWANMFTQAWNRRPPSSNKSGHIGVQIQPNQKYTAYIRRKGKRCHLGTFNTYEEAVEARERAEKELYPTN